ncbi:hypothetical protein [Paraburkholderia fynbosensis]|uniref:Uncharacterized protein n=1 Tax=Paraburkholderia fynbosensis TaxID=1200993 RepID=A0A6J5FJY2_9BURK|nr:hypothetical protein [Paraburkholderia fynbosensis]CAB3782009.1 hypothetical protein LMG27177_01143 [Paraburkholderia fynbosensis]
MSMFDLSQSAADALFKWSNVVAIVGAVLAAIGAYGSFWTGNIRDRYSDERISKNEADTASARKTAAVANESAAKASENVAKANERTELLRQSNLEVQRQLEKERLERLRLEASIAPRRLSEQQRWSLVSSLQSAPQPLAAQITLLGDEEAGGYEKAIWGTLNAAKVQVAAEMAGIMSPPPYGVQLTLQKGNPRSAAIKSAFESAHIPITTSYGEIGKLDARILIGLRPLGVAR